MKPEVLQVAKPCSANWEEMRGDDNRRFCEHCQKHVHNASAMSQKKRAVLAQSKNEKCIFYFQRRDGTVADLSLLARLRRRFPVFRFACWSTLVALLPLTLTGCMGVKCPPRGDPRKIEETPQTSPETKKMPSPKDQPANPPP